MRHWRFNLNKTLPIIVLAALVITLSGCNSNSAPAATVTVTPPPVTVTITSTPISSPVTNIKDRFTSSLSPSAAIKGLVYTNSQYGFSLNYPKDWDMQEDVMGSIVFFGGPLIKDDYMISIGIITEKLPKTPSVTLKDYAALADMQLKKTDYQNFTHLEEYDMALANYPAKIHTYTFSSEGTTIKGAQVLALKDNYAYIITYSATPDSYYQYRQCLDDVVNSFKFQ